MWGVSFFANDPIQAIRCGICENARSLSGAATFVSNVKRGLSLQSYNIALTTTRFKGEYSAESKVILRRFRNAAA